MVGAIPAVTEALDGVVRREVGSGTRRQPRADGGTAYIPQFGASIIPPG